MPLSVERFSLGHSMVTNQLPDKASLGIYVDIPEAGHKLDIGKFGLWDCSTPNFNTYYPDVTAEDLKPKDDEFAYPIFRALSSIIIGKYGRPVDFTKPGVLKKSVPLLVGQSMLTNHDQVVGAEVGVVVDAVWEREKTYDTYTIPAGINIKMKLDGKSNPKLVRGVMMNPPSVHSISVTVAFKWDQSHTDMPSDEFWNKLGTYDEHGVLIARVVTEIIRYDEVSFVTHGADPFAQKIVDGTIANPEYAKKVYQFNAENKDKVTHFIDWKGYDFSKLSMSAEHTIPAESNISNNGNQTLNAMNKELLLFLITTFAMDANSTEAQVTAKLNSELPNIIKNAGLLAAVQEKVTKAEGELTSLKAKYPEGSVILTAAQTEKIQKYDAMDAVMVKVMLSTRQEALRLYNLSVGGADKADAAITKMIAESNFETITALAKQYSTIIEASFEAECQDCHSHNISRSSSISAESGIVKPEAGDGKTTEIGKGKSIAEVSEELYKKATSGNIAGSIHGTKK